MPSLWLVALAGAAVGSLYGTFGVGGAVAGTPLLALAGVPALIAVGSTLPAAMPAALIAAVSYARRHEVDFTALVPAAFLAAPAAFAGALLSGVVGGTALLIVSGLLLAVAGIQLLRPPASLTPLTRNDTRRTPRTMGCVFVAAFLSGLLANGGAALLIPLFVVVVGMDYRTAAGTSLLIVPLIALPALVTHAALGHIDWTIAAVFAAGEVPAAAIGAAIAGRVSNRNLQRVVGCLLVTFAIVFLSEQVLS